MLVPAGIYLLFNYGGIAQAGQVSLWLPILLCIGNLILIRNRVPLSLKIFLALAVIDDLGAIMVIAIFYTKTYGLIFFTL
jgi:NhaA family Na+:H+ antiporter